jgi:hypothetical protein
MTRKRRSSVHRRRTDRPEPPAPEQDQEELVWEEPWIWPLVEAGGLPVRPVQPAGDEPPA